MFIPGDVLPVLIFLLIMIPLVIFLVQRSRHRAKLQKEYDELKQSESGVGSMTEEQEVEYEKIRDAVAVASVSCSKCLIFVVVTHA